MSVETAPSHTPRPEAAARPKIFGIGWAKTGTTSLGAAFEILGRTHVSIRLDLVEALSRGDPAPLHTVADAHDSFDDWPWTLVYKDMARRYPDAKFVLTLRDPEAVVRSYRKMVGRQVRRYPNMDALRRFIYGFDPENAPDAVLADRVQRHNEEVAAHFADRPGRLLTVDWTKGDGWSALCGFMGCEEPETPFPHSNPAARDGALEGVLRRTIAGTRRNIRRLFT